MEKEYYSLGSGEKNLLGSIEGENIYDYAENYSFDTTTKNESHAAILRQVSEKSTVLDVGCASGIIGKALKKYKGCTIDGIDYDKTAIEVARKSGAYRDLFSFSITEEDSKQYKDFFEKKIKYDYVIFADVLEHLVDPWNAIKTATKLLKKGGSILISLPNIANLDIIRSLTNEEFNYQKHGVLDSTHLRFFTQHSFKDMLQSLSERTGINYNIELCEKVFFTPTYSLDLKIYDLYHLDNRKINEFLVIQNIFKISIAKNAKEVKYKGFSPRKNYFDVVNNKYTELVDENQKLREEITMLKNSLELVSNENDRNIKSLQSILNSKRWKIVNKILKVFGK